MSPCTAPGHADGVRRVDDVRQGCLALRGTSDGTRRHHRMFIGATETSPLEGRAAGASALEGLRRRGIGRLLGADLRIHEATFVIGPNDWKDPPAIRRLRSVRLRERSAGPPYAQGRTPGVVSLPQRTSPRKHLLQGSPNASKFHTGARPERRRSREFSSAGHVDRRT